MGVLVSFYLSQIKDSDSPFWMKAGQSVLFAAATTPVDVMVSNAMIKQPWFQDLGKSVGDRFLPRSIGAGGSLVMSIAMEIYRQNDA